MGKSFNCITDALAQIKASDARISMDDPDAASFMDMPADTNGPEETMQKLSRMVLQTMKLDNLVEEMKLPLEISPPEKKMYLYCLMYPEYFGRYPKGSFVTALYQSAISGHKKKLPHYFLSGSYGAEQNARIFIKNTYLHRNRGSSDFTPT